MTLYSLVSVAVIILYTLGSIGSFWGIPTQRKKVLVYGKLLTLSGFALHTLLMISLVLLNGVDDLSKGYFMQLLGWSILLMYFIGWRYLKSSFLAMTAAPFALILFVLAFKLDHVDGRLPSHLMELFFALHIGPMFLSLGLLALAFGAALLFLRMERKIKTKARLSEFEQELPALNSFDRVNYFAVVLGFPLYTLGVASGFAWAPSAWGASAPWQPGTADPKVIITLFVWFLYATLFHLRLIQGWRGRKAAIMVIWIFAISMFSLIGVNFFMPTHHSFVAN